MAASNFNRRALRNCARPATPDHDKFLILLVFFRFSRAPGLPPLAKDASVQPPLLQNPDQAAGKKYIPPDRWYGRDHK